MKKKPTWLYITLSIVLIFSGVFSGRKAYAYDSDSMKTHTFGDFVKEENAHLALFNSRPSLDNKIPHIGKNENSIKEALSRLRFNEGYGKLPMSFEANKGQTDSQVKFLSRGHGQILFLTSTEAVFVLRKPMTQPPWKERTLKSIIADTEDGKASKHVVLRMKLVDANQKPQVKGLQELPGRINYLIGNEPKRWHTDIPTFSKVKYRDVYPGIDLFFYGNQQHLEYDFVISPGAGPERILLNLQGADKLEIDTNGNLVMHTAVGQVRMVKPFIYQEKDGLKHEISGGFVLCGKHQVGFQVGDYDRNKPLVIDPTLEYSTYLGAGGHDIAHAIAVDAQGSIYVTGGTDSSGFPGAAGSSIEPDHIGGIADVFVTKLNAAGSALIYSTYLGGSGDEAGFSITVDTVKNAYVTGGTTSTDFTGISGSSLQASFGGGGLDAFVTKLNAAGSAIVYSTYFGGTNSETAHDIAVDSSGNAYIAGDYGLVTTSTTNNDLPGVSGSSIQPNYAYGDGDGFVAKLNTAGSALIYSTYLGGGGMDRCDSIAVDAIGNAYVTGVTSSSGFPGTTGSSIPANQTNPVQGTIGGESDAFVTKLNAAGSALVYSTYLGGSGTEVGDCIALDAAANAYVSGHTNSSTDFPLKYSQFQPNYGGGDLDGYVTKLNFDGSDRLYSVYLGGSGYDIAGGIAVDVLDDTAYVSGFTNSPNFPGTSGSSIQATYGGGLYDAFLVKLVEKGYDIDYSTYLGGNDPDASYSIATDYEGNALIAGETRSTSFPGTIGSPIQANYGGGWDAFIAKIKSPRQMIRIPIRFCAVQGSPAAGNSDTDAVLLQRLQKLTEFIWAKGAYVTFQSAMPAGKTDHFPVIADPNTGIGSPGDILRATIPDPRGGTDPQGRELKEAVDACDKAWDALGISKGPVAINLRKYVDLSGSPILGGWGTPALTGNPCGDPSAVFSNDGAYAGVTDNSFLSDSHEENFAHELGHVLSLMHGNGLDDDDNGIFDGICDDGENPNASPSSLMSQSPGSEVITSRQARRARAVARVTSGSTTSASKAQPADTISDHRTDPAYDVTDDSVDVVSIGMVENTEAGKTIFSHTLFGMIPSSANQQYLVFADLDDDSTTGGSPSDLGLPTGFEGAELVTRVLVAADGSGLMVTPTIWQFETGSFVEVSDPQIEAGVSTMIDGDTGVALRDVVYIHAPSSIIGLTGTQVRIQGIAEQLPTGQLDRLPDASDGGANISLIPLEYPECDVTLAQGQQVPELTLEAIGLVAGTAKVFLGDQLVTTKEISQSNPTISFSVPSGVGVGLHLITVEVEGTALSAGCLLNVLDDTPPDITIIVPLDGNALQDGVTLTAEASDNSGVTEVYFYVREKDGANGTPVGYEDLPATLNATTGKWEYDFDTTQLPDGYYVILAKAKDIYGNEGWNEVVVPFSIRNWAVVELLPPSAKYNAGRTMPVKFSLRITEAVNSQMPFVYNEELEIRIYKSSDPSKILQTSLFGDTSIDYRISSKHYITNFKTDKKPAAYTVEVWRTSKNFLIGSFTFETSRK